MQIIGAGSPRGLDALPAKSVQSPGSIAHSVADVQSSAFVRSLPEQQMFGRDPGTLVQLAESSLVRRIGLASASALSKEQRLRSRDGLQRLLDLNTRSTIGRSMRDGEAARSWALA